MERFSSGYNLPRELVEQIPVKLPVKSLLRFKSVCKSWNYLICSQKFVDDHLQANIKRSNTAFSLSDKSTLVIGWACLEPISDLDVYENPAEINGYAGKNIVLSLASIGCGDDEFIFNSEIIDRLFFPSSLEDLIVNFKIRDTPDDSHCNGVLCLVKYLPFHEQHAIFYNLALREHRSLIVPSRHHDYLFGSYGFGYDPRTSNYMFVRVLIPRKYIGTFKAELYTLGTDCWKEVEIPNT